jgi:hypothetical protein
MMNQTIKFGFMMRQQTSTRFQSKLDAMKDCLIKSASLEHKSASADLTTVMHTPLELSAHEADMLVRSAFSG